jgi:hypothetical protein
MALASKRAPIALTINGIDGFLSGKWVIYNNSVNNLSYIDDATVSFLPNQQFGQIDSPFYSVMPNTNYSLSVSQCDGNGAFVGVTYYDANKNLITNNNNGNNLLNMSFTTPSNCYYLGITLASRATSGFTPCTFKKPMLNLGATPVPYEPKRGERMVMPTVKKNLVVRQDISNIVGGVDTWDFSANLTIAKKTDGSYLVTTSSVTHSLRYTFNARNGKTYTVSWKIKKGTQTSFKYSVYDITNLQEVIIPTIYDGGDGKDFVTASFSFTATKDAKLGFYPIRDSGQQGTLYLKDFQLEEGTTATPYTPYAVQLNPKPFRSLAAKRTLQAVQ